MEKFFPEMDTEHTYDAPAYVIGKISAFKYLDFSDREAGAKIYEWVS